MVRDAVCEYRTKCTPAKKNFAEPKKQNGPDITVRPASPCKTPVTAGILRVTADKNQQ
jgi:hypothetical protein